LGKSFFTNDHRKSILNIIPNGGIFIYFTHPEGKKALLETCIKRINNRLGHTFSSTKLGESKVIDILEERIEETSIPSIDNGYPVLFVDVSKTIEKQIINLLIDLEFIGILKNKDKINAFNNLQKTVIEFTKIIPLKNWRLEIQNNSVITSIHPSLNEIIKCNIMNLQKTFHITLTHITQNPSNEICLYFLSNKDKEISIDILGLAWNTDILALKVQLPSNITCQNKYPHITIAYKNGIKPFMSNKMLENKHEEILFDIPINVKGIIDEF